MDDDYPRARVLKDDDGNIYLDDPTALGVVKAVEHHNRKNAIANCRDTLEANADRVTHFKQRIADRGEDPMAFVIVLLNVDDQHGGPIADLLMPGFNWQEIRDRGETPFARGLAGREAMQEIIAHFDAPASDKLQSMKDQIAVVVVDHNIATVHPA